VWAVRACQPHRVLSAQPKSKRQAAVLDGNPEIQSKKGLFKAVRKKKYAGILKYVPSSEVQSVDANSLALKLKVHGKHKVNVLNLIAPQRADSLSPAPSQLEGLYAMAWASNFVSDTLVLRIESIQT
jgi:sulfide dehydrogenase [flavocytochrome c] flavoprotein chain